MNQPPSLHTERPILGLESASVLIVGCGLIGTSIAMAIHQAYPTVRLIGVDQNDGHAALAKEKGVFERVLPDWPDEPVHLTVLAIPAIAAVASLALACRQSEWVMDVCSVKGPLCDAALSLDYGSQFAPTHPMAGLASEGPRQARADLFEHQPWLLIRGFAACEVVAPLLEAIGAKIIWLDSAQQHDEAIAVVSHTIHLTSLSAMLAYDAAQSQSPLPLAILSGPGFRDITRLAESPSGFWVDTLLENRAAVIPHIQRTKAALESFETMLTAQDGEGLRTLLDAARLARNTWKQIRDQ